MDALQPSTFKPAEQWLDHIDAIAMERTIKELQDPEAVSVPAAWNLLLQQQLGIRADEAYEVPWPRLRPSLMLTLRGCPEPRLADFGYGARRSFVRLDTL